MQDSVDSRSNFIVLALFTAKDLIMVSHFKEITLEYIEFLRICSFKKLHLIDKCSYGCIWEI